MSALPFGVRYAAHGDARIAYQVLGQGSIDLLLVPGFPSNLEIHWEDAGYARLLRRLCAFSRLIHCDPGGSGLSDRVDSAHLPTLATRVQDLCAVLDAAGSGRAALFALGESVPVALQFAADHPDRVRALALYGGYACFQESVLGAAALARHTEEVVRSWGTGAMLRSHAPGRLQDAHFRMWWSRLERLAASPTAAIAALRMHAATDARAALSVIGAPTLVMHRIEDAWVEIEAGRQLAASIQGARMLELPGRDHAIGAGDVDRIADATEEFVTGARPHLAVRRTLAALQVARIAAPQRLNVTLGDDRWLDRIERLRETAGEIVRHSGGRIFRWETETMFAHFDGPARAAHCAIALREAARRFGLHLAQGLHVGEVEIHGDEVAGIALFVAERIAECAGAGELLASALTAELAAGSGLHFVKREGIVVDGLERPLDLVAVVTEQHLEPAARKPVDPDFGKLSAREREVLTLVSDGLSNASIAMELRLSEHTVKRHIANILLKLDLPTRAAAAALAARQPLA